MQTSHRIFPVPTGNAGPRFDRVNTLRTLAITAVFFYHAFTGTFGGSVEQMQQVASVWPVWMRTASVAAFTFLAGGYQLVSLFFVMAGFFLHRSFLSWHERNPSEPWGRFTPFFLWRRFWRIVPPFWVALLFSYFLAYHEPFSAYALRKLAVNATLLKTLFPGYFFSINHAHWYVAVQWQLDLLCPVFLYLVWRRSFVFAFTVVFILGLVFNTWIPSLTSASYIVFLPFRWWADWAFGAFIAHAHSRGRKVFARPGWMALGVIAGLLLAYRFNLSLLAWLLLRVGLALALEWAVLSRLRYARWERRVAPIGLCSYSIYLFHIPLITLWDRGLSGVGVNLTYPPIWLATHIACFAAVVALCWLSYRYLEEGSAAYGARLWRKFTLGRPVPHAPQPAAGMSAAGAPPRTTPERQDAP